MAQVIPAIPIGGVFGAGSGSGDGGDPARRPGDDPGRGKAPLYKASEAEKYMSQLEEQIRAFMPKRGQKVKLGKMTQANLELLLQGLRENSPRLFFPYVKNNTQLLLWNDDAPGSPFALVREPTFRNPNDMFNPSGGENYLLAILIAASAGCNLWRGNNACVNCQNGRGKFQYCITFPGAMHGACINCGWSNHFE